MDRKPLVDRTPEEEWQIWKNEAEQRAKAARRTDVTSLSLYIC